MRDIHASAISDAAEKPRGERQTRARREMQRRAYQAGMKHYARE